MHKFTDVFSYRLTSSHAYLSIVVAGVYALATKLLPLSIKLSFHEATELSKLDESGSGFLVTFCTAGYKNFIHLAVCCDMEGDNLMVTIKMNLLKLFLDRLLMMTTF